MEKTNTITVSPSSSRSCYGKLNDDEPSKGIPALVVGWTNLRLIKHGRVPYWNWSTSSGSGWRDRSLDTDYWPSKESSLSFSFLSLSLFLLSTLTASLCLCLSQCAGCVSNFCVTNFCRLGHAPRIGYYSRFSTPRFGTLLVVKARRVNRGNSNSFASSPRQ